MEHFWKQYSDLPQGLGFEKFSATHLMTLAVIFALVAAAAVWFAGQSRSRQERVLQVIPWVMILLECCKDVFLASAGHFGVGYLPLHLCGLGAFVFLAESLAAGRERQAEDRVAVEDWGSGNRGASGRKNDRSQAVSGGVNTRDQAVSGSARTQCQAVSEGTCTQCQAVPKGWQVAFAEISVMLILPGSLAALLFPDWIHLYPVLNFMNLYGFAWHGLLLLYPVLLIVAGRAHLSVRHAHYVALFLVCVSIPVYLFDRAFDCNYMFLNWPPKGTPLSWIASVTGEQWYLAGYAAFACIVLGVIYLGISLLKISQLKVSQSRGGPS